MIKLFTFLAIAMSLVYGASAQQQSIDRCATSEYMQQLLQTNPGYAKQLQDIETFTQNYISSQHADARTVVTVPVVIHIVYNGSTQNISDALASSQVDILNEDYRRLNADASKTPSYFTGVAADCEINFCIAARDPQGNATNGIRHVSTTHSAFTTNDDVKYTSKGGDDAWDRNSYLNIWVCNLGQSLLGYAQFPGGPASTDGVVILYSAFGRNSSLYPYNLGRSATHEVGHWLNLYHIWGDDGNGCNGSDQCNDTPNQGNNTFGCPSGIVISCTNGPNGNMYQNYMDYSDDRCMNIFTTDQKSRMQALFASGGARISIASSQGCVPPNGGSCGTPSGLNATGVTSTSASLNWSSVSGATGYNVQYRPTGNSTWSLTSSASTSVAVSGLTSGTIYEFQVQASCSSGNSSYSGSANFTTTSNGCSDIYEPNNGKNKAAAISVNTNISALIATSTDVDWFSFSNSASTPNIQVSLTNLPQDYDLQLYNPSGTKVATSNGSNTLDEIITYNNGSIGKYKIKVYPYNSGDAINCYTLTASVSSSPFRSNESARVIVTGISGIYPNPSNGLMNIEYSSSASSNITVYVMDVMGRIVFSKFENASEGLNTLNYDFSSLNSGIYIFEIRNGNEISHVKFMIEK
ncbi:MAG: T9SS type A sorting domain-containing protein [Chitinophagales bacterium]|nr:T9SS type A sorting domain-containing protein [Chitinophagales bacterium]